VARRENPAFVRDIVGCDRVRPGAPGPGHASCFDSGHDVDLDAGELMAVTQRRKLLTAAIGVATVSYVMACGEAAETSGNLVAAGGTENTGYGGAETSGNLVAAGGTQQGVGGSAGRAGSGGYGGGETAGNLVSLPPSVDAGAGAGGAAGSAADAGETGADSGADAAAADAAVD
jgi:hypothetical protein